MNCNQDIILIDNDIKYYFKYLEWDSDFFQKNSYYLDIESSQIGVSSKIKKEIKEKFNNSFITIKLNTNIEKDILYYLQDCGFNYIDTEVVLEYKKETETILNISKNVKVIKKVTNEGLPYESLGKAFTLTRFHSEKNIDNNKADLVWVNYLKNYKVSKDKYMYIAQIDGRIAGVILANQSNDIVTLFFVAVLEEFRGYGVGKILIKHVLDSFKEKTIRTETQVQNINALNYYINSGLSQIVYTSTVLHRWDNND